MTSETLVSLNYENRGGTFTGDVGVVSSADRLQFVLFDEFGLPSDH